MRSMPWTYDLTSLHFRTPQWLAVVCATVFYCVKLSAAAYDNDGDAVDLNGEGGCLGDGIAATDINPVRGHEGCRYES